MKIKYIFLASAMALFTQSCSNEFLTDEPVSSIVISETTIKTQSDLESAVNGLYAVMNTPASFGANHFTYQELTGDLGFVSVLNSGRFTTTANWGHLNPDGGASGALWNSLYYIIANANFILSFENKLASNNSDSQVQIKQLFAEARAVRAYSYSTLLGYFSPNFGEGNQSLGVPYPTTFDIDAKLPRAAVGTVYTNVVNDLTTSIAGYSPQSPGNKRFNKAATQLLLARVLLAQKKYPEAANLAQVILDDGSSTLLTLADAPSYYLLSSEDSFSETLFQIQETPTENLGTNDALSAVWSSIGTYKQNFMSQDFYKTFLPASVVGLPRNLWASRSTDVRARFWYNANTFTSGLSDDPQPIDVRKNTSPARDVIQFRKTEAVFIKVEALYHTNPAAAATALQNWVVEYRDPTYINTATSGTALLDEILRQKGFEFFLEGTRFFDLKRNNKPVKNLQTKFVAEASDYRFLWPIPLNEIQTNPNMIQNPGY